MTSLETVLEAIGRRDAAAVKLALDTEPGLANARAAGGQTPAIVASDTDGRTPAELARGADHAALAVMLDGAARRRVS